MSRRRGGHRRPEVSPPPGQGRTVATWAPGWGETLLGSALVLVVLVLFLAWRGGLSGPDAPVLRTVLALVAVSAGAGWLYARGQVAAGAGWLSSRGLLRRRWVRTDDLATVTETPTFSGMLLHLRDREGRRLSLTSSGVTADPRLAGQLRADLRTSTDRGLVLSPRARAALGLTAAGRR